MLRVAAIAILAFMSASCTPTSSPPPTEGEGEGAAGEGEGEGEGAGEGEGEGEGEGGGVAFASTYALFVDRCTGCHGSDTPQGNLDLSSASAAYDNLVNVVSDGPFCGNAPHTRVIPGNADDSLLYQKVAFTFDCGLGMPEHEGPGPPGGGATPLTADELATVHAWIEAGANP